MEGKGQQRGPSSPFTFPCPFPWWGFKNNNKKKNTISPQQGDPNRLTGAGGGAPGSTAPTAPSREAGRGREKRGEGFGEGEEEEEGGEGRGGVPALPGRRLRAERRPRPLPPPPCRGAPTTCGPERRAVPPGSRSPPGENYNSRRALGEGVRDRGVQPGPARWRPANERARRVARAFERREGAWRRAGPPAGGKSGPAARGINRAGRAP